MSSVSFLANKIYAFENMHICVWIIYVTINIYAYYIFKYTN